MPNRKVLMLSTACFLFGSGSVIAETLPDFLASELAPLIAISSPTAIDPGVYTLAGANQPFSDEIACIVVKYFGQSEQVERDMLAVVDIGNEAQRAAVVESINTCLRAGEDFDAAAGDESFEQGSTVTNSSSEVNSAITPN